MSNCFMNEDNCSKPLTLSDIKKISSKKPKIKQTDFKYFIHQEDKNSNTFKDDPNFLPYTKFKDDK